MNVSKSLDAIFDALIPKLNEGLTLVGQFKEMNNETQNLPTESETSRINEETRDAKRGGNSHSNVKGQ